MSETKVAVDQFPRSHHQTRHSLSAGLLLLTNLAEDPSHVHATEQPSEERKKTILSSVVAQGLHSLSVEGRSKVWIKSKSSQSLTGYDAEAPHFK